MNLTLSQFLAFLVTRKPFYGRLISSLERVAKPGLGTMAVGIRAGRAVLFFDPKFLADLSLSAGAFVVEHEMLHLVLDHIPRYLELLALQPNAEAKKKAEAVYNIAMDCSINTMLRTHDGFEDVEDHMRRKIAATYAEQHAELRKQLMDAHAKACEEAKAAGETLPELPKIPDIPKVDPKAGMVLPEKYDLPMQASFETYQYLLMQSVKITQITLPFEGNTHGFWQGDPEGEGKGEGEGKSRSGEGDLIFDVTSFGDLSSEELMSTAQHVRQQLKEVMHKVVRNMGGSLSRGTLPGGLEEWLKDYLADPIIPWWEVFAARARQSRQSKHARSVQQPNRSLLALSEEDPSIIPAPGRVRDVAWRIFFMVDTSGSMSSESLRIAKSELAHMLAVDEGMEIRYMQGDCAIVFDEVLVTGDEIPTEVHGRGGTDFNAYFTHMAKYMGDSQKEPDLVVVYTDGYAPPVSPENRLARDVPVLWLVTPDHSNNFTDGYGEIIVCDPKHNERHGAKD